MLNNVFKSNIGRKTVEGICRVAVYVKCKEFCSSGLVGKKRLAQAGLVGR
jgi:hypothetical protein